MPLGGIHDGGADAFQSTGMWEGKTSSIYYQASTEDDHRSKISKTVGRLKEFGRTVKTLVYITSNQIKYIDMEEQTLSDKHKCLIRIRDGSYLSSHINETNQTKAAYVSYLAPSINFLRQVGGTNLVPKSKHVTSPAIYVFLSQELERREGKDDLLHALTDGLILWALEGTDPDQEIKQKIEKELPLATKFIIPIISKRLHHLSTIPKPEGRSVRWHKKEDKFCISYDIRFRLEKDNASDEALRISFFETIEGRIVDSLGADAPDLIKLATNTAISAVQRTFETEGLYFRRLSETYTLLFCLNTEPRVVQFFNEMTSDFKLFVGSDIVVRALSEKYLRPEDQATRNTLRIIHEAGGSLILTEPVLDEVFNHIVVTNNEYKHFYQQIEGNINPIMAKNSDHILIRAYFYSRFYPPEGISSPINWQNYIEQFCDYSLVHKPAGREQIKRYLTSEFNMIYESHEELLELCDNDQVQDLTDKLKQDKKEEKLAYNDALMVLSVYGKRKKDKETSKVSVFGYRTWWLTSEKKILRYTNDLIIKEGSRYMMRPEFLLNFITLNPSLVEVKKVYKNIFPSVLGLRLARRIDGNELRKVLKQVKETSELDPGRREAKISELSDNLKADFYKKYSIELD